MNHYRWISLLGAIAVCAVAFAAEDEKGFVILMPNEIVYEKNPAGSGPDFAVDRRRSDEGRLLHHPRAVRAGRHVACRTRIPAIGTSR